MAAKKKATTRSSSTTTRGASDQAQPFADYDDRRGSRGLHAQPEQQHDARDQRDDQSTGRSDNRRATGDAQSGKGSRLVSRDADGKSPSVNARAASRSSGKAVPAKASTPESKKVRVGRSTA